MNESPVREIRTIIKDSGDPGYVNRLMVGTAVTGLVRVEWMQSRYGQTIPCNWSWVQMLQYLSSYMPLRWQVADAQNLIVKVALEGDFEWLLLWEHDTFPLNTDALIRLNQYMHAGDTPVVSGLYYSRSIPTEPLVYRGRGNGYYGDWALGDKVWCDGVPTGFLLIHTALLRAMWAESEEYVVGDTVTRRVFDTPRRAWLDPETGQYNTTAGTSDLDWCTRILREGFFRKSGWTAYEGRQYPFLVDTAIACSHINPDGTQFPGAAFWAAKRAYDAEQHAQEATA